MAHPPTPWQDRIWKFVVHGADDECWPWQGRLDKDGYGHIQRGPRGAGGIPAHRAMYELLVGPVDAESIDHLCRNPRCVNPKHLEPVSHRTNILRGTAPPAANARRTHCVNGHEFSEGNTYRYGRRRVCKRCIMDRTRRYRSAKVVMPRETL